MQSSAMSNDWATEHLQIIRTLMERSAIYRRALAPTSLLVGTVGVVGGTLGWSLRIETHRAFGIFWGVVCLVALAGAFVNVRRQALRDAEPFWSAPTRRVTEALVPPLVIGLVAGVLMVLPDWREPLQLWWLPPVWMVLYGCALHAAGFFMPRGIRLFGWGFVIIGCGLLAILNQRSYAAGMPPLPNAHLLMGGTFGGLHLAYGAYLWLTEKRKNEA
jgi:hypothetical protein